MVELSMTKGEKVELTKTNPGLTKIIVGGGWDVNKNPTGKKFDLDLSAYLLGENKKIASGADVVYYKQKNHSSGAIYLDKDNLTGEGEGEDEKIFVDISKIPTNIHEIVFAINIYEAAEKEQNFGMVENTFIQVRNPADNKVLIKYNPSENFSTFTGLIAGKIYRNEGEWKFQAIGDGVTGTINDIANRFQ